MNLIELLPEKDKQLMTKYIHLYGIGEKSFIGLDQYLKYWAESKKKLYKLLGNQFQLEIPFSHEKSELEMRNRFAKLLQHPFMKSFVKAIEGEAFEEAFDKESLSYLYEFHTRNMFYEDKTRNIIKFKPQTREKETRLQMGMKPIRALQRIANSFPDLFSMEEFEDFRIKHSLCLNDKYIKGTLVLSIHPFDFITMSDNDSDWSSCMSWTNEGCYHMGTVEMMNSNNVIVAYIKSSSPYCFDKKNKKDLELVWNNKKWRQLIYVTKDIIVSGKPYPYPSRDVSITAIEELKKMAEKNLSWTYTYGPERYSDMKHINSMYSMDRNRGWLHRGESTKHNIIFDTKGMYNDMLNDNDTTYWCVRNKVPKMRIISVSGKAPCACCGSPALIESDCPDGYNDRWEDPEKIVCWECFDEGLCDACEKFYGKNSLIKVKNHNNEVEALCSHCASTLLKICPCCGEPFRIGLHDLSYMPGIRLKEEVVYSDFNVFNKDYYYKFRKVHHDLYNHIKPYEYMTVIPAFMCNKCIQKDLTNPSGLFIEKKLPRPKGTFFPPWVANSKRKIISKKIYTEDEIIQHPMLNKMLRINLEPYNKE